MPKAFALGKNGIEKGFYLAGASDGGLQVAISEERGGSIVPPFLTKPGQDFKKFLGIRVGIVGLSAAMHPSTQDGSNVLVNYLPGRDDDLRVSVQITNVNNQPIINGLIEPGDARRVVVTLNESVGGLLVFSII